MDPVPNDKGFKSVFEHVNTAYEPPTLISTRMGFSADHSHECEGCPICGAFGPDPSLVNCELCGSSPGDRGYNDYCQYCSIQKSGDFCQMSPAWCSIHHRRLKFKASQKILAILEKSRRATQDMDEDDYGERREGDLELAKNIMASEPGTDVELNVCLPCYSGMAAAFRYCPACKKNVPASPSKACEFCGTLTLVDVPDAWAEFKRAYAAPTYLVARAANPLFRPSKDHLHILLDILAKHAEFDEKIDYLHDDIDAWDGHEMFKIELPESQKLSDISYAGEFEDNIKERLWSIQVIADSTQPASTTIGAAFTILKDPIPLYQDAEEAYESMRRVLADAFVAIEKIITKVQFCLLTSTGLKIIPDDPGDPNRPFVSREKLWARAEARMRNR
ncbi:MAG: hypothetical protein GYA24_20205 [Candidatus Lokiarchaeota archaeon]|nr:hypothetical protein [Candidatus Lokiarchaeota archaeon]